MKNILNRATITMTRLKTAATVKKSWFGFGIVEHGKSIEKAADSLGESFVKAADSLGDSFVTAFVIFSCAVVILSAAFVVSAANFSAAPKRKQE